MLLEISGLVGFLRQSLKTSSTMRATKGDHCHVSSSAIRGMTRLRVQSHVDGGQAEAGKDVIGRADGGIENDEPHHADDDRRHHEGREENRPNNTLTGHFPV